MTQPTPQPAPGAGPRAGPPAYWAPPGAPPPGYAGPQAYPSPHGYPGPQVYPGGPGYTWTGPALSPGGQPLASFGDRFLAYLIDTAILTGVAVVLMIPVMFLWFGRVNSFMTDVSASTRPDDTIPRSDIGEFFTELFLPLLLMQLGLVLVLLAVYYVYFVELMVRSGQTVGKRALKLRTVPLDPARALDRGMAARRYLVQYVAGSFVPGLSYLDGLWQLWDKPYQQCLHDKFGRTLVVKVPG